MTEPWWISLIKAVVVVNVAARPLRVPDAGRAQGDGTDAAPLRPEPRRQVRAAAAVRRPRQARSARRRSRRRARSSIPYILAPIVSAFTAIAAFAVIPWGPGWTINGWHINGEVANVSIGLIADLRARLDRHLRLHRRRLGVRVEVLAPRLDAHVRAARLVRGLARAQRARRRHPRPLAHLAEIVAPPGRVPPVRRAAVRRPARLLHRRHRRDEPRAVRPARGRVRSSSPATTPSTRGCAGASSRWPSTST